MLGKIKSIIKRVIAATFVSRQGFVGAFLTALAIYFCVGLVTGTANIQNYFRNRATLAQTDAKIADLGRQLEVENRNIKLLQSHSPDFVSEMALRHLNMGDPKIMMIKK